MLQPPSLPDIEESSHYCTLVKAIEEKLFLLLRSKTGPAKLLHEAAEYTVLSGGKRLRPLLCLLVAEMYGVPYQQAIPVACAFELVHSYSLIHDDLPAMDNDDFRRGKPTLHRVYPEGHAILTGDYLLTYAFEVLSAASVFDANIRIRLVELLAKSAGASGMVGGQALDLQAVGNSLTLEELQTIHRGKTGRLIQAAMIAGALMGDAPTWEQELLASVGDYFGLAFQIVDDLLDIDSSAKKRSSDIANGKSTYVTLLGTESARERAFEYLDTLEQKLALLINRPSKHLLDLAKAIISRNAPSL